MKRLLLLLCLFTSFGLITQSSSVQAATSSDFQAGRIIDDGVFFNPNTLRPIDIQSFLNSKVPVCDTNHPSSNPSYQPPFTCLKDYRQDTPNKWSEPGLCGDYQGGNKSAAEIIYYVGQSCGINPKVLIVLLEKEQSLITDDWPWSIQYRSATGYGCPDTAPCDAEYYGFFNQVYNAARQFKRYARDSSSFRYRAYRDNYIQYNPNAGCGGTNVFIQNQATAGLYNYTPYQPNPSALANLYGSGDSCGAYGNRNFWRLFTDWFGTTHSALFSASFYRQSEYPVLGPGESRTVSVEFRNNGNWDWHDDAVSWPGIPPVHLAATNSINRSSIFSYTWPSAGRASHLFNKVYESDGTTLSSNQHIVKAGQIAKFEFNVTAPWTAQPGIYREHFQPVLEGSDGWNIGGLAWLDIRIKPAYSAVFYQQSAFPTIGPGQSSPVFLSYRNTGASNWYDDVSKPSGVPPIHLSATNPINRSSIFSFGWPSAGRPNLTFSKVYEPDGTTLAVNQHVVQPNQIAKFEFNITAPWSASSRFDREYFQPVLEGAANWQMGGFSWLDVTTRNQ